MNLNGFPLIVYRACVYGAIGYGNAARNYVLALDRLEARVKVLPLGRTDIADQELDPGACRRLKQLEQTPLERPYALIEQILPTDFRPDPEAILNIGYTVFETDRCPVEWLPCLERMDDVWVPSSFVAESFKRGGANPSRVFVIPHGVDTTIYNPQAPPINVKGKRGFNFVSVLSWQFRKGPDLLFKAYFSEFSHHEDVALILKASFISGPGTRRRKLVAKVESVAKAFAPFERPSLLLYGDRLNDQQMAGLYTAADCFVLPTRGEGWGLPLSEAMACGLPVITTNWGGSLDFASPANSYLIDVERLVQIRNPLNLGLPPTFLNHFWAEPSVDHLRLLMRRAFTHRQEAREKGETAAREMREKWSWDAAARKMIERIKECLKRKSWPSVSVGNEAQHAVAER